MNTQIPKNAPKPVPIPDQDYDDFLEWTSAEEDEFMRTVASDAQDDNLLGNP